MNKQNLRRIIDIFIAVSFFTAWFYMLFRMEENPFASNGIETLKYFTILSNMFAAFSAVIHFIKPGRTASVLKYISADSVALTFLVVVVFLGPIHGYGLMFMGANLWFHVIIPIAAVLDHIFLNEDEITAADNRNTLIPVFLYGVFYIGKIVVQGFEGNDWYTFFRFGTPTGILIILIIFVVVWAVGFFLRKANKTESRQAFR